MSSDPMAPETTAGRCRLCQAPLPEGADPQRSLCPRCNALQALDDFAAEQHNQAQRLTAARQRRHEWKRWRPLLLGATIAACLIVVAIRMPALSDALQSSDKPMRHGVWDTDARTDACIDLLWDVSARLQQGLALSPLPTCPASGQPFEVRSTADDVIVRSPTPERYGLKEIRVSKRRPIPELIR